MRADARDIDGAQEYCARSGTASLDREAVRDLIEAQRLARRAVERGRDSVGSADGPELSDDDFSSGDIGRGMPIKYARNSGLGGKKGDG